MGLEYQVHKLKVLMGPVQKAKNIVTWKVPAVSGTIVAALLAFAFAETLLMLTMLDDQLMSTIKHVLYQASIVARVSLGIWILFCQAPWFQWIRSVLKVAVRMVTMRRKGPKAWSFFRPDD